MDIEKIVSGFEDRIRTAAHQDRIALAAGMRREREDLASWNVARALRDVGRELQAITKPGTNEPLSPAEQDEIADALSERLGHPLKVTLGEASVEHFLRILSDIEAIINKVKSK